MTTTPATNSASPSTSSNQDHEDLHNGASSDHQMSVDPEPESQSSDKQQQQQQQQHQQQQHQRQLQQQPQQHQQSASPSSSPPQQKLQPQQQSSKQPQKQQQPQATPTNIEQKRPMNAFLLFCKKQRSLVREKYPNLENRGITKILGDWWSNLDQEQKSKYTDLARQHKEAFMEANPDFKWCRTPIATNNSSSSSSSSSSSNNNNSKSQTTNSDDCLASNNKPINGSPPAPIDIYATTNGRDTFTNHRQQQNEAPKPPKKRYLERNEPVYSKNQISKNEETNSNAKDHIVPYMQLDQATLGRVIEKALSEKSNDSPTGLNMCKDSNRNSSSNNLTTSVCLEPNPFTTSTTTIATTALSNTTSSSTYSNGDDEPVDFSMKVTFRATNQSIIDNVVEKAYSGLVDIASGTSRSVPTSSAHSQLGVQSRRVNAEET